MNDVSQQRLGALHPVVIARWKQVDQAMLQHFGIELQITEGARTWETQAAYWAKGRTVASDVPCVHDGIARPVGSCPDHPLGATVTNARPGWSWHQFALCLDAYPDLDPGPRVQIDWKAGDANWNRLTAVAGSFGLAEGSAWRTRPDWPHFYPKELPANPPDVVRALYQGNGLPAVWQWADALFVPTCANSAGTTGGTP